MLRLALVLPPLAKAESAIIMRHSIAAMQINPFMVFSRFSWKPEPAPAISSNAESILTRRPAVPGLRVSADDLFSTYRSKLRWRSCEPCGPSASLELYLNAAESLECGYSHHPKCVMPSIVALHCGPQRIIPLGLTRIVPNAGVSHAAHWFLSSARRQPLPFSGAKGAAMP